jgi:D-alanine-D-alanine ligase
MGQSGSIEIIKNAIDNLNQIESPIAILLIVNLKSAQVLSDYTEFSVLTEYFSDQEFEDLFNGFKEFASFIDVSFGEKEFIEKLTTNHFDFLNNHQKIVYASTGTGTSRCRSAITPSLCEIYDLKYCSNDIFTAALLENKISAIRILREGKFPIPNTYFYELGKGWLDGNLPSSDCLLIAKPAYECASIGIDSRSVSNWTPLFETHIKEMSLNLRQPIIVQEFIQGYEIEVPVLNTIKTLTPGCIGISMNGQRNLNDKYLTYELVYHNRYSLYNYDIENSEISQSLKLCARQVFTYLQLKGTVRIDFRVMEDGRFYIMDCNNSPHIVPGHSVYYSFEQLGFTFPDMLKTIVSTVLY